MTYITSALLMAALVIDGNVPVGVRGPAVTTDGGKTWNLKGDDK